MSAFCFWKATRAQNTCSGPQILLLKMKGHFSLAKLTEGLLSWGHFLRAPGTWWPPRLPEADSLLFSLETVWRGGARGGLWGSSIKRRSEGRLLHSRHGCHSNTTCAPEHQSPRVAQWTTKRAAGQGCRRSNTGIDLKCSEGKKEFTSTVSTF